MLRIIRGIYRTVKSCVKHSGQYSDFFYISLGLRQGEIMSPILFALFIEDLELYLQDSVNSGLTFDDVTILLLLFADDMVLFAKSPGELQTSLINCTSTARSGD